MKDLCEECALILEAGKSIRSLGQLWEVVEEFAGSWEGVTLPSRYKDNLAFTVLFQKTDGGEDAVGFECLVEGNPRSGVSSLSFVGGGPELYKKKTEQIKAMNATLDELEKRISGVMKDIDVDSLYPYLEKVVFQEISNNKVYRNLLAMCKKVYVPNKPHPGWGGQLPTAAVGWNKKLKRFTLFINKTFAIEFCFHYLFGSWDASNYSRLKNEIGDYEILARPLQFLIMHEMGHILFRHTTQKQDILKGIPGKVVNLYGDTLINIGLTGVLRGGRDTGYKSNLARLDVGRAPLSGQSNSVYFKFQVHGNQLDTLVSSVSTLAKIPIRREKTPSVDPGVPYSGFYEENPFALVRLGINTSTLIQFYAELHKLLKAKAVRDKAFEVGDLVRNRKTGRVGVVTKIHGDGKYTVEYSEKGKDR